MRQVFAFFSSLLIHVALLATCFWVAGSKTLPEPPPSPAMSVVSFDFGELIAARKPEPAAEPEPIVEPEPVTEPEPAAEPEPVVTPVVPVKPLPKKKVVKKKRPKKKVVKKKQPPKKKPAKKKVVKKKRPTKKQPPKKSVANRQAAKQSQKPSSNLTWNTTPLASGTTQASSGGKAKQKQRGAAKSTGGSGTKKATSASMGAYRRGLQRAIDRAAQRSYPKNAKRMKKQGTVRVRFTLSKSGKISGITVVGSSGNASLDKAAKKALRRLGRYKAPPPDFPTTLTVPIRFVLR